MKAAESIVIGIGAEPLFSETETSFFQIFFFLFVILFFITSDLVFDVWSQMFQFLTIKPMNLFDTNKE